MAINNLSIYIANVTKHNLSNNLSKLLLYDCKLLLYLCRRKSRVEITVVNYHDIFNNIGPKLRGYDPGLADCNHTQTYLSTEYLMTVKKFYSTCPTSVCLNLKIKAGNPN
jgi:hypothetical protein